MKPEHIYDPDSPKKAVNLSANADLLRLAKGVGINLSQTLEEALLLKVRAKLEAEWLDENKQGIAAYNTRIERNGIFGASKRRF